MRVEGRNRIAQAMELAEVTQVQVAERTKLTQSYISRVRAGQYSDLPGETMRLFAECFGCAIEDLFPARTIEAAETDRRQAGRRDGDRRTGEDRRSVEA